MRPDAAARHASLHALHATIYKPQRSGHEATPEKQTAPASHEQRACVGDERNPGARPAGRGRRVPRGGARRGRRGRVRGDAAGQDGAEAGAVRVGGAEPELRAVQLLLQRGAQHREAEPQVPLRRHAVQDRQERRDQGRGRHHHPQTLQPRRPPHRLQVRRLHSAMSCESLLEHQCM